MIAKGFLGAQTFGKGRTNSLSFFICLKKPNLLISMLKRPNEFVLPIIFLVSYFYKIALTYSL